MRATFAASRARKARETSELTKLAAAVAERRRVALAAASAVVAVPAAPPAALRVGMLAAAWARLAGLPCARRVAFVFDQEGAFASRVGRIVRHERFEQVCMHVACVPGACSYVCAPRRRRGSSGCW